MGLRRVSGETCSGGNLGACWDSSCREPTTESYQAGGLLVQIKVPTEILPSRVTFTYLLLVLVKV